MAKWLLEVGATVATRTSSRYTSSRYAGKTGTRKTPNNKNEGGMLMRRACARALTKLLAAGAGALFKATTQPALRTGLMPPA